MTKQLLAISIALLMAAPAFAAPPVRLLYAQAAEKEEAARAALADPAASVAALKPVRRAIAAFEAVVNRYPTSSYSDNALWRAGRLALDAFDRWGEPQDRQTGLRLLRLLASEYPSSKLAKKVDGLLAKSAASASSPTAAAPTLSAEAVASTADTSPDRRKNPQPAAPKTVPVAVAAPASPVATTSKPATITAIRRAVLPDVVRVTIALDAEVSFHEEHIAGPSRIFIDFPATKAMRSLVDQTLRFDGDAEPVRQVRVGRHPNTTTRVVLDATDVSSYSVYPLYNPYRLVVDCLRPKATAVRAQISTPAPLNARPVRLTPEAAVKGVRPGSLRALDEARAVPSGTEGRVSQASNTTTIQPVPRAPSSVPDTSSDAMDLSKGRQRPLDSRRVASVGATSLPSAVPAAAAALDSAYVSPLAIRAVTRPWADVLPARLPQATGLITEARATAPAPGPSASPAVSPSSVRSASAAPSPVAAPTAPSSSTSPTSAGSGSAASGSAPSSSSSRSSLSMARQLGLGVSRIVIDPGHGGHDPGAKGKGGVSEAELVLDVSLRLKKLLEKTAGVEVILTRETDCFIPLQERTAIANRESADLFLSVHANASANDQAHGVETYFLNFANNISAAAVAARENAASGQAMGALPDFVKAIALNNKLDESRDFAGLVQQTMVERLSTTNKSVKSLGVKQAPFVVLIGASMPSVLAEISFVTNPQEAKLLKGNAYRQKIAEALFDAVRRYQTSLTPAQKVALQ